MLEQSLVERAVSVVELLVVGIPVVESFVDPPVASQQQVFGSAY